MASIFKRRKGKNEPYSIQYRDHGGKRLTVKGFTDKGLTEQLAARLEDHARMRQTGLIDAEQERLALSKQSPLAGHLAAFEEHLGDNSPNHVRQTMKRVRLIVAGCGFEKLADIESEKVKSFLRSLRTAGKIGNKTYNHYLQSLDSLCNWCVATKRLISNPIRGIERLNTAIDVRRPRRALTPAEMAQMVQAARSSGVRIRRYTGEQRARVYLLSYLTGLRKQELASLAPRSFALDASPPTVTVEAAYSKRRRKDVLPLHPYAVSLLRGWLAGLAPGEKLFPKLACKATSVMVQRDLKRAGIAYKTDEGFADFHAAGRHTHITELLRNGATLPEVMQLARHSNINLTMRYTHIGIGDQARAVTHLPTPKMNPEPAPVANPNESRALHGRCISGGAAGHSVSPDGNETVGQKRDNPCADNGFDADRRQMSSSGTMPSAGTLSAIKPSQSTLGDCDHFSCHCVLPQLRKKLSLSPWPEHGVPMPGGRGANGFTHGTRFLKYLEV